MAIDRDATVKQAEKLLRQGKLDGAIEQYVRLIADQPEDWNAINTLGDLYLRAGKIDLATEQFIRIADHQFAEGFLPKSAALYKKALKTKADDEHILMQLAEIGERQGKFADAKFYLHKVAKQRQDRGEDRAAADCILRLGSLEGSDLESKIAAARAAQSIGDAFRAVELLKDAAHVLEKDKRRNEAFQLLADAAEIDPFDAELRNRLAREFVSAGQPNRARAYLSAETAGDDPDLLLAMATIEFADGKEDDARTAMARVLALAPEREPDVTRLADELIAAGRVESAYACVDAITDAALLKGDLHRAASALQTFVGQTPHLPALTKLVAIAADANIEAALQSARAQLVQTYLDAAKGDDARAIAEDLVRGDPASDAHATLLHRALVMLGIAEPDEIVMRVRAGAAQPAGEDHFLPMEDPDFSALTPGTADPVILPGDDLFVSPERGLPDDRSLDLSFQDEMPGAMQDPAIYGDSAVTVESSEIDLSGALSSLTSSALDAGDQGATEPPEDIEDVFAQMRAKSARDQQASAALGQYEQALQYLDQGLVKEAITELESAAEVPMLRFRAAARLGRVYVEGGDVAAGVEWLERAAEAPAPTPEEGHALLYDLAAALQTHGESSRALALLMELDADAGGFRDVRERIAQLNPGADGEP